MNTFGYFSKGYVRKKEFFHFIDSEGILDYETKQYYWEEYVISHNQDLESFYSSLDPANSTSRHIKNSVKLHFHLEPLEVSMQEPFAGQEIESF